MESITTEITPEQFFYVVKNFMSHIGILWDSYPISADLKNCISNYVEGKASKAKKAYKLLKNKNILSLKRAPVQKEKQVIKSSSSPGSRRGIQMRRSFS